MSTFSTGLALFSMFFGAGNIIFPLVLGRLCGGNVPTALLGLGLSAVIFPFLGLITMMLYGGSIHSFLSRLGKWPAFIALLVLQVSQGPLGVMPRLITLMHASVKSYLPVDLFFFSILVSALIFFLTYKPQRIIHLLGVVLTPLLLLTLAGLVFVGWMDASPAPSITQEGVDSFGMGLKLGYQTTDLVGALLFATVILPHLARGSTDPKRVRKQMISASLIASGLLMAAYVGLSWIASQHAGGFGEVAPEELLQRISIKILGPYGALLSSSAAFLACLTTAISLGTVFAQYVQHDLTKGKMKGEWALFLTLAVTAAIANLGFSGIVKIWGPILDALYPALIVLCVVNIAMKKLKPVPV